MLEKNYLVANNLPTSSFGWTLYQVASNPNTIHRIKMNIKNVLKCKFGIFTCPSSWIYIVLFTFFICERQDTALPLHFDSSPFLKSRGYTHPAPFEAAQNNLPKGFPALFARAPTFSQALFARQLQRATLQDCSTAIKGKICCTLHNSSAMFPRGRRLASPFPPCPGLRAGLGV